MPDRFETGQGKGIFSAVVVDINRESGRATGIQRLQLSHP